MKFYFQVLRSIYSFSLITVKSLDSGPVCSLTLHHCLSCLILALTLRLDWEEKLAILCSSQHTVCSLGFYELLHRNNYSCD